MTSLNDILWGDTLENLDGTDSNGGVDTGVMPNTMNYVCLAMCCGLGKPCNNPGGPPPCVTGYFGCK